MAQQNMTPEEQLLQLRDARKLVLSDVKYYPNIVQVVLPILAPTSGPTVRRWVADFIAEAFASPALPSKDKETLCLLVLEHLKQTLERPKEDPYVLQSAIMAAASIYPLAMRWIINNSYDTPTWERMSAIKSRIFRLWDESTTSIKICCVKFTQRVVLAQTATNVEQQRRDGLEVSLAMVPAGHTLLDPRNLEAEATGLLDRMLGVLQDNSSDALVVDATLNCLSVLVRTRPSTASRIMNAILNFNPLKLANSPMTPKTRVLVKSMEKTTRMLLIHLSKRDPHNPFAPRIQQYVERLLRSRSEIFDDASRKRAFAEQQAAYIEAKRQRLSADTAPAPHVQVQPLAPGPNSLAAIFTLTGNTGLQGFDAAQMPAPMAARIAVSTLSRLDPQILTLAVTGIRDRLASLAATQAQAINPDTAPLGVEEDDDDYEPDYYAAEDTEQILNKLDGEAQEEQAPKLEAASLALGAFKLPPAPSLNPDIAAQAGQGTVTRVFGAMQQLEDPIVKKPKAGINRLAASSYDRDSWLTVITRLATRASAGLENVSVKDENGSALADRNRPSLSNAIREMLYNYVLEDFRKRIEVAVAWLCEEWYNDALQKRYSTDAPLHYDKWALKLVDGFFPYLNPQDKVLTRFLGEIPEVNASILARVTKLCRDPSMVQLAITSLLYLVMMKPPARLLALNTVQDIWFEYEDARPMAGKVLVKWRPGFIESHSGSNEGSIPSGSSGVAVAT